MPVLCFGLELNGETVEFMPYKSDNSDQLEQVLLSRGLSFGQGVFETLAVVAGQAVLLDEHLKRLDRGAFALKILFSQSIIQKQLCEYLAKTTPQGFGVAKISLFAGAPVKGARGYAQSSSQLHRALVRIECDQKVLSWPQPVMPGVSAVRIAEPIYPWPEAFVGLKMMSAVQYVHWTSLAVAAGFDQGILFDEQGLLVEGTSSNIILCQMSGPLQTPAMTQSGVHGVLRHYLLKQNLIECSQITEQNLYDADVVFLCNSVRGLQRLTRYEGLLGVKTWSSLKIIPGTIQPLLKAVSSLFSH